MPTAPRNHRPQITARRLVKPAPLWKRLYGSQWAKSSRLFLELNPMCAECGREGRMRMASVTDHIQPHRGDLRLFWDRTNWQPLCKPCHDRKTAREVGFGGDTSK
jgi:5-methylcytosine-specific restriction protein A